MNKIGEVLSFKTWKLTILNFGREGFELMASFTIKVVVECSLKPYLFLRPKKNIVAMVFYAERTISVFISICRGKVLLANMAKEATNM